MCRLVLDPEIYKEALLSALVPIRRALDAVMIVKETFVPIKDAVRARDAEAAEVAKDAEVAVVAVVATPNKFPVTLPLTLAVTVVATILPHGLGVVPKKTVELFGARLLHVIFPRILSVRAMFLFAILVQNCDSNVINSQWG